MAPESVGLAPNAAEESTASKNWTPPADPDFQTLAETCWELWKLDRPKKIAIDTETTGLAWHDRPFGVSVAWRTSSPALEEGTDVFAGWVDLEHVHGAAGLVRRIVDGASVIVGHNLRFDRHKLDAVGIPLTGELHDTQIMAHLLDENRPSGLKTLAATLLDEVLDEKWQVDKARVWAKKTHGLASVKEVGYHLLPRGTVVPYAIKDAEWTYRLAALLTPQLADDPDLWTLYERERSLSNGALYDLERAGLRIDTVYVEAAIRRFASKVEEHLHGIEAIVGKPCRIGRIPPKERDHYFNPASNKEVGEWFTARGMPAASYDVETLSGLDHPLAAALLALRKDKKLLDTYLIALRREAGSDGVFHPSIRQTGTVSGRTSSGGPTAE